MYKNPVVRKLVVVCDATTYVKDSHKPKQKRFGPAACGVIFLNGDKESGEILWRGGTFLGEMTNNQAESNAILFGLKHASEYCMWEIEVWSDNQLTINHLTGVFRIKKEKLGLVIDQIKLVAHRYEVVTYHHHSNKDPIARLAHDEAKKYQQPKGRRLPQRPPHSVD